MPVDPKKPDPAAPVEPEELGDGIYLGKDGEKYALAIFPDYPNGRTHHLANTVHRFEGTEAEFRKEYSELDGTPVREAKPASSARVPEPKSKTAAEKKKEADAKAKADAEASKQK